MQAQSLLRMITAGVGCLLACSLAAAETNAVQLRSEAQVDGQGIYLDQIIVAPAVVHIQLTNAPAFGSALVLTRAQVNDLMQRRASQWATTNWTGADRIRITRQSRVLHQDEMTTLLAAAMQQELVHDRGDLEIRMTQTWPDLTIPDEPVSVKLVELPGSGLAGTCIVRFQLRSGRDTVGEWSVALQAHLMREVWVAQTALRRGDRLQTSNLTREKRDVLSIRDPFLAESVDDLSLELNENLQPGAPLLARSVRLRPVVRRGKLVDAVVQQGSLTITVKAQAMEDGLAGQSIRMRNSKTGREFRGKVQNEETVEVIL